MADNEDMQGEEAEAWAAMREAFADDDEEDVEEEEEATAYLKQQNTALAFASALLKKTATRLSEDEKALEGLEKEVEEPADVAAAEGAVEKDEEADAEKLEAAEDEAWAELRAAFGDESMLGAAAEDEEDEDEDEEEDTSFVAAASKPKSSALPNGAGSRPGKAAEKAPEPAPAVSAEDEIDQVVPGSKAWLQEQVDQLVGESQRIAGTSFTPALLGKLWALPLEEQHDVLLGATGAAASFFGETHENATKLWKMMSEEIDARRGIAPAPLAKPVDGSDDDEEAPRKVKRSRSRSVSI